MFRFDKEEIKKIMEVADLLTKIKDDKKLEGLKEENVDFNCFIESVIDTAFDLNMIMKFYDNYLRDEFCKLYAEGYIDANGFNRNETERTFKF